MATNKSTISFIALFISTLSFLAAVGSAIIAYKSLQDARAIALFDAKPEISFQLIPHTFLNKPPHFIISNTGRGDAELVEIAFVFRYYDRENKKLFTSTSGPAWTLDLLKPMAVVSQALPDKWDEGVTLARPSKCEPHHRVLVIRITYFSGPDRQKTALRTFYFNDANFYNYRGDSVNWHAEGTNALKSGEYPDIVKAALRSEPLPDDVFGSGTYKLISPKLYKIDQNL